MARFMERQEGIYKDKPELVFKAAVSRKTYTRRLRWAIITLLAGGGVFLMLSLPDIQTQIDAFTVLPPVVKAVLIIGGRVVALGVLLLGSIRTIVNLVAVFRRRTEQVRFYDVGFAWQYGDDKPIKYGWNAVKTVIENPRARYFRKKPVLEWGHVTFKMRDGQVFRMTGAHGDLRAFLKRVRPHYAAEIGTRMGQRLRMEKSFRVHPDIVVTPAGVAVGDQKIAWKSLKAGVKNRKLVIMRLDGNKNAHPVAEFHTHKIENLAGFLELVDTTTELHQRPNPYA